MSDLVVDIVVTYNDVMAPVGYRKMTSGFGDDTVAADLNHGRSATEVYLWCKFGRKDPITGLSVTFSKDSVPEGWQRLDRDLQKGADGPAFLCVRRRGADGAEEQAPRPVAALTVEYGEGSPGDGWERVESGLQRGQGPAVYLWLKRAAAPPSGSAAPGTDVPMAPRVSDFVDCRDASGAWRSAQVLAVEQGRIQVDFVGEGASGKAWVPTGQDRVAPFGSHTASSSRPAAWAPGSALQRSSSELDAFSARLRALRDGVAGEDDSQRLLGGEAEAWVTEVASRDIRDPGLMLSAWQLLASAVECAVARLRDGRDVEPALARCAEKALGLDSSCDWLLKHAGHRDDARVDAVESALGEAHGAYVITLARHAGRAEEGLSIHAPTPRTTPRAGSNSSGGEFDGIRVRAGPPDGDAASETGSERSSPTPASEVLASPPAGDVPALPTARASRLLIALGNAFGACGGFDAVLHTAVQPWSAASTDQAGSACASSGSADVARLRLAVRLAARFAGLLAPSVRWGWAPRFTEAALGAVARAPDAALSALGREGLLEVLGGVSSLYESEVLAVGSASSGIAAGAVTERGVQDAHRSFEEGSLSVAHRLLRSPFLAMRLLGAVDVAAWLARVSAAEKVRAAAAAKEDKVEPEERGHSRSHSAVPQSALATVEEEEDEGDAADEEGEGQGMGARAVTWAALDSDSDGGNDTARFFDSGSSDMGDTDPVAATSSSSRAAGARSAGSAVPILSSPPAGLMHSTPAAAAGSGEGTLCARLARAPARWLTPAFMVAWLHDQHVLALLLGGARVSGEEVGTHLALVQRVGPVLDFLASHRAATDDDWRTVAAAADTDNAMQAGEVWRAAGQIAHRLPRASRAALCHSLLRIPRERWTSESVDALRTFAFLEAGTAAQAQAEGEGEGEGESRLSVALRALMHAMVPGSGLPRSLRQRCEEVMGTLLVVSPAAAEGVVRSVAAAVMEERWAASRITAPLGVAVRALGTLGAAARRDVSRDLVGLGLVRHLVRDAQELCEQASLRQRQQQQQQKESGEGGSNRETKVHPATPGDGEDCLENDCVEESEEEEEGASGDGLDVWGIGWSQGGFVVASDATADDTPCPTPLTTPVPGGPATAEGEAAARATLSKRLDFARVLLTQGHGQVSLADVRALWRVAVPGGRCGPAASIFFRWLHRLAAPESDPEWRRDAHAPADAAHAFSNEALRAIIRTLFANAALFEPGAADEPARRCATALVLKATPAEALYAPFDAHSMRVRDLGAVEGVEGVLWPLALRPRDRAVREQGQEALLRLHTQPAIRAADTNAQWGRFAQRAVDCVREAQRSGDGEGAEAATSLLLRFAEKGQAPALREADPSEPLLLVGARVAFGHSSATSYTVVGYDADSRLFTLRPVGPGGDDAGSDASRETRARLLHRQFRLLRPSPDHEAIATERAPLCSLQPIEALARVPGVYECLFGTLAPKPPSRALAAAASRAADAAWSLLQRLPTHPPMQRALDGLLAPGGAEGASQPRDAWADVLGAHVPLRLLYGLRSLLTRAPPTGPALQAWLARLGSCGCAAALTRALTEFDFAAVRRRPGCLVKEALLLLLKALLAVARSEEEEARRAWRAAVADRREALAATLVRALATLHRAQDEEAARRLSAADSGAVEGGDAGGDAARDDDEKGGGGGSANPASTALVIYAGDGGEEEEATVAAGPAGAEAGGSDAPSPPASGGVAVHDPLPDARPAARPTRDEVGVQLAVELLVAAAEAEQGEKGEAEEGEGERDPAGEPRNPLLAAVARDGAFASTLVACMGDFASETAREAVGTAVRRLDRMDRGFGLRAGQALAASWRTAPVRAEGAGELCGGLAWATHERLGAVEAAALAREVAVAVRERPIVELSEEDEDTWLRGMLLVLRRALEREDVASEAVEEVTEKVMAYLFEEGLFGVPREASLSADAVPPLCKHERTREEAFYALLAMGRRSGAALQQLVRLALGQAAPRASAEAADAKGSGRAARMVGRSSTGFVGLRNLGCTCYMNALLQQLFMVPEFRSGVLAWSAAVEDERESVLFQLQRIFASLLLGEAKYFDPAGFCHAFKDLDDPSQPTQVHVQRDASHFLQGLFQEVAAATMGTEWEGMLEPFAVKAVTEKFAKGGLYGQRRPPPEPFVICEVKGKSSLEESLISAFSPETVEFAWELEDGSRRRVDTQLRNVVESLPTALVCYLKRFELDYTTFQTVKVNDRLTYPRRLDMLPFTVEGRRALEGGAPHEPGWQPFTGGPEELAAALRRITRSAPPEATQYELHGVTVHSGTANAGHYYSYIRERGGPPTSWFEFNDTWVTPFDASGLPDATFGGRDPSTGVSKSFNAFMLVYDRVPARARLYRPPRAGEAPQRSWAAVARGFAVRRRLRACVRSVRPELLQRVHEGNVAFWHARHVGDATYAAFVRELFESSGGGGAVEVEEEDDRAFVPPTRLRRVQTPNMALARLGALFVLSAVAEPRKRGDTEAWTRKVQLRLAHCLPANVWLVNHVARDDELLRAALTSSDYAGRRAVTAMLGRALRAVAPHERDALPAPAAIASLPRLETALLGVAPVLEPGEVTAFLEPRLGGASEAGWRPVCSSLFETLVGVASQTSAFADLGNVYDLVAAYAECGTREWAYVVARGTLSAAAQQIASASASAIAVHLRTPLALVGRLVWDAALKAPRELHPREQAMVEGEAFRVNALRACAVGDTAPLSAVMHASCCGDRGEEATQQWLDIVCNGLRRQQAQDLSPYLRGLWLLAGLDGGSGDSSAERRDMVLTRFLGCLSEASAYVKPTEVMLGSLVDAARAAPEIVSLLAAHADEWGWAVPWLEALDATAGLPPGLELHRPSRKQGVGSGGPAPSAGTATREDANLCGYTRGMLLRELRALQEGHLAEREEYRMGAPPSSLLGCRVLVRWPSGRWYEGVVISHDPASYKHRVLFDDGDCVSYYMRTERFRIVERGAITEAERQRLAKRADAKARGGAGSNPVDTLDMLGLD